MSIIDSRLQALRQAMMQADLNAWIVPTADPHLSEYLPEHWQIRQWLSGFTGSAGTLVILLDQAALWTDGRYWQQAERELASSSIHLEKWIPELNRDYISWLVQILPTNAKIGIDGNVCSLSQAQQMRQQFGQKNLQLITKLDLITPIWQQRPALPKAAIYEHPIEFAMRSRNEKLIQLRQTLREQNLDYQLLSSLDDIAWLFNLRGQDVDYNPVFLAHALISQTEAFLYVDSAKLSSELQNKLQGEQITLRDYQQIAMDLTQLPTHCRISLDPAKVTINLAEALPQHHLAKLQLSPTTLAKACKNDAELAHIREAMIQDGAALCRFFAWLEAALARKEAINELMIAEKLAHERSKGRYFVSLSFTTIAGFNANGALPHYHATSEAFSQIAGNGLLLIDSGGQYFNGTTDITRVVPIGEPNDRQLLDYTTVLKGMIALSQTVFPALLPSPMLDAIARAPIWAQQLDYNHGTGHGVGYFLNVHEGPQVISCRAAVNADTRMVSGMITSIEPGIYRPEQWGIRIENLVATRPCSQKSAFGQFLQFETLTLCPLANRLIKREQLSSCERQWVNDYHAMVRQRLQPHVDGEALTWLLSNTEAL